MMTYARNQNLSVGHRIDDEIFDDMCFDKNGKIIWDVIWFNVDIDDAGFRCEI